MDTDRAFDLLTRLAAASGYDGTSAETQELSAAGLVAALDVAARARLADQANQASAIAARVRALRAALDQRAGPKPDPDPLAMPVDRDPVRAELVSLTQQLELVAGAQSVVAGLVEDGSGGGLRITLNGRQTLGELDAWRSGIPVQPLDTFLASLRQFRETMDALVVRAQRLTAFLAGAFQAPLGSSLFRGPALLLAKRGPSTDETAGRFEQALAHVAPLQLLQDDTILVASLLALSSAPPADVESVFDQFHAGLGGRFVGISDNPTRDACLVSATLSDLPAGRVADVLLRFDQLKQQVPDPHALPLAALTRAPYAVPDTVARYAAAQGVLQRAGYGAGDATNAAAALLASSMHPPAAYPDRFSYLDGRLREVFEPAGLAAALLATAPYPPSTAYHVYDLGIGTITRNSFFDVTAEIDYLALLLVYGMGPLAAPVAQAAAGFTPGTTVSAVAGGAAGGGMAVGIWPMYHRVYMVPMYTRFVTTHPVHFHAVPVFG